MRVSFFWTVWRIWKTLPLPARIFPAWRASGSMAQLAIVLLKPQTFMNLSGRSIMQALQFYKIATCPG